MRKTFLTCASNPRGTMKYYLCNNETAMCVSVSLNHYRAKSSTKIGIYDIDLGIDTERRIGKNVCKKNSKITKNSFSATSTSFPLHSPSNSPGTYSNDCCFWSWSTAPSLSLLDSAEAESCASHVKRTLSTLVQSCVYKLLLNLQLRWNNAVECVGQGCMFEKHFLRSSRWLWLWHKWS